MENSSQTMQQEALARFRESALALLENYFEHTNQILGVTGFGFALACVGLDLPSLFAWMSIVFLAIVWGDKLDRYKRHINALRRALGAPQVHWLAMLWRTRVAILGWLALACVALDLVNKHGIVRT